MTPPPLPDPRRVSVGHAGDFDAYVRLVRDRARWLLDRGLPQWTYVLDDPEGLAILRDRAESHEVYLFPGGPADTAPAGPLATVCLQLSDPDVWGDDPHDAALYVHGLATRLDAPPGTGAAVLAWCERRVECLGRRLLRLDCWDANDRLKAYYAACGFHDRGVCLAYGPDYPARRWEKPVA